MNKISLILAFAGSFLLVTCAGVKEQIGLNKSSPDEFQVVRRAPLEMPPDYSLATPQPGAPRPQEQAPEKQAAQAIFGEDAALLQADSGTGSGEAALLSQAGVSVADPAIRRKVDQETAAMFNRNKPVAERLLGIGGDADEASASVVDAQAEVDRLKSNAAQGKPVTSGDTPSIEE
ncbi:MAG: DUF3035 domain-containing protein [Bdellovibrionales bacterium]